MKIKETVDFIKTEFTYKDYLIANYHGKAYEANIFENKKKKLIKLLQRGEKFENMWKLFKKIYSKENIYSESGDYYREIALDEMKEIEQKYFPKEK